MLGRLLYHAFWNFYDHLGLYVLAGIVHGLLSIGLVLLVLEFGSGVLSGPGVAIAVAFALLIPTVVVLAALMRFSARGARGEPVRMPDLWRSLHESIIRVTQICLVWVCLGTVLYLNFYFYVLMQGENNPSFVFAILAALDGWLMVILVFFFWPVLCGATAGESKLSLRRAIRNAFVWVAVTPLLWVWVFLAAVILLLLGAWSRAGLLLYVPVMAALSQSAAFLSAQYVGFLADSGKVLGDSSKLSEKKKWAREQALEWEAARPARTLKELIKPWEY